MALSEFLETYKVVELAIIYGLLLGLAVLATLWMRGALAALSRALRLLHGAGLIRLEPDEASRNGPSVSRFDRTFLSITRLLERTCHRIPGDPNRHAHPFVLALLLVGVPILLAVALVTFVVPFLLFSYVTRGASLGPALVSVIGYAVLLPRGWRALRRVPDGYDRLRRMLRRRTPLA